MTVRELMKEINKGLEDETLDIDASLLIYLHDETNGGELVPDIEVDSANNIGAGGSLISGAFFINATISDQEVTVLTELNE